MTRREEIGESVSEEEEGEIGGGGASERGKEDGFDLR